MTKTIEEFKFTIDTRQTESGLTGTDRTFGIPTIKTLGSPESYNWDVEWGDGKVEHFMGFVSPETGAANPASVGLWHTYSDPGQYQITIRPHGNVDRWMVAYQFGAGSVNAVQLAANKNKVVSLDSPLTPLMVASRADVDMGRINNSAFLRTFYGLRGVGVQMGADFGFSPEWDDIEEVGTQFCCEMFYGYTTPSLFTMNETFNLPKNIKRCGNSFCVAMFQSCRGANFSMNSVFNLPQNLEYAETNFAHLMFDGCRGAGFKVNGVFKFPVLPQAIIDASFQYAFRSTTSMTREARTIASIVNGNPNPTASRSTFNMPSEVSGQQRWSDWDTTHANWK